jgi:hypothetical protein
MPDGALMIFRFSEATLSGQCEPADASDLNRWIGLTVACLMMMRLCRWTGRTLRLSCGSPISIGRTSTPRYLGFYSSAALTPTSAAVRSALYTSRQGYAHCRASDNPTLACRVGSSKSNDSGTKSVKPDGSRNLRSSSRQSDPATATYQSFLKRLRAFRVLDPACGSGNFLYLALLALKDLAGWGKRSS